MSGHEIVSRREFCSLRVRSQRLRGALLPFISGFPAIAAVPARSRVSAMRLLALSFRNIRVEESKNGCVVLKGRPYRPAVFFGERSFVKLQVQMTDAVADAGRAPEWRVLLLAA